MKKMFAAVVEAFSFIFKTRLMPLNDPFKHMR